jgi:hypothetical protein
MIKWLEYAQFVVAIGTLKLDWSLLSRVTVVKWRTVLYGNGISQEHSSTLFIGGYANFIGGYADFGGLSNLK